MTVPAVSTDFFESSFGMYRPYSWRGRRVGFVTDALFNARLHANESYRNLPLKIQAFPPRAVLIIGVEVPGRRGDLQKVMDTLAQSRHRVTLRPASMEQGRGKFQNINSCLTVMDMTAFDWLVIVDDDIDFASNFLDRFLYLAEAANLALCQPAHRFSSFQSYELTQRGWNSLVRVTRFVECGPITAFRRDIFSSILPFPDLRWAWGTDILWGEIARKEHFRMGIIDATPIRHLRPVAGGYSGALAIDEAKTFLQGAGIVRPRKQILETVKTFSTLP